MGNLLKNSAGKSLLPKPSKSETHDLEKGRQRRSNKKVTYSFIINQSFTICQNNSFEDFDAYGYLERMRSRLQQNASPLLLMDIKSGSTRKHTSRSYMRPGSDPHDTSGSPWSTVAISNDAEVKSVGYTYELHGAHQPFDKTSAKETMAFFKSPRRSPPFSVFHKRQTDFQKQFFNASVAVQDCFGEEKISELCTKKVLPRIDSYHSKNCHENGNKSKTGYESGLKTLESSRNSTNEEERLGFQALVAPKYRNSSTFSTIYPPRMHSFEPNYSKPQGRNHFDKSTSGVEMDDVDDITLMDCSELVLPKNSKNSNTTPITSQGNNDSLSPLSYDSHSLEKNERKWHPRALFETNPCPIPRFNSSNGRELARTPVFHLDPHLCPIEHNSSLPLLDDQAKIETLPIISDGLVVENSHQYHANRTMNISDLDIFKHNP